ncbi:unnamed protein product, partial [Brassica napus]
MRNGKDKFTPKPKKELEKKTNPKSTNILRGLISPSKCRLLKFAMDKKSATAEDDFDTKVNLEKQKDLIAHDQSDLEEEDESWSDVEEVVDEEIVPGGSKILFARNLSFQVERSDIEEFFKEAGQVVDIKFDTSKKFGEGRYLGFGI